MKKPIPGGRFQRTAFTLIELLVVIAVIGILAGMLLAVGHTVGIVKIKSTATAELKEVETAIEAYKAKLGFYPPDNPTNVYANPLYYELVGTIFTNHPSRGWGYFTLDNNNWIATNAVFRVFGVTGFANSASSIRGDDDRSGPINFLKDFRNMQGKIARYASSSDETNRVLLCSIGWDMPNSSELCTWRYNSSHPTNNPSTYDLWVNLYISDKTNRISNWSKKAQLVN